MKVDMINGGKLRNSDLEKKTPVRAWDLIATVEEFVKTVVDEQKAHGTAGDQTYITQGEAALAAIRTLKQL